MMRTASRGSVTGRSILLLIVMATATSVLSVGALAEDGASATPLTDATAVELGKQYFNRACTYCHGKEGAGGKTPSFKGRKDFTPDYLFDTISNGRIEGANIMPAWKGSLSSDQISQLVAYIMFLASQPTDP